MVSYASDYLYRSNVESVTVAVTSPSSSTVCSKAFREDIDAKRAAYSGIEITGKELLWLVPVAQMGSTEIPAGGATITDGDSVVWQVKQAKKTYVGSSPLDWECLCLRQK